MKTRLILTLLLKIYKIEDNTKWSQATEDPYGTLIIDGSESEKTDALPNLRKQSTQH